MLAYFDCILVINLIILAITYLHIYLLLNLFYIFIFYYQYAYLPPFCVAHIENTQKADTARRLVVLVWLCLTSLDRNLRPFPLPSEGRTLKIKDFCDSRIFRKHFRQAVGQSNIFANVFFSASRWHEHVWYHFWLALKFYGTSFCSVFGVW